MIYPEELAIFNNMFYFNTNNGGSLRLHQYLYDGSVTVNSYDDKFNPLSTMDISNGDMVMLINYYRYVKENDIQNDFINPSGKVKE